jgi:hypothetical protein
MNEYESKLQSLSRRVRLQALALVGACTVAIFAAGGADAIAGALTETDGWIVSSKNAASTLTPRITVTTGEDQARVKIQNAHLELAQQSATAASPANGSLWYDTGSSFLKYRNSGGWVEASLRSVFQARLVYSNPQVKLMPYAGRNVEVGGETLLLSSSGIALSTSDNRIDSSGGNAAASMSASTPYFLYVSNSQATYAASSLRASTTAPSLLDGVKYLGTSGNAARWRFVAWVRTNAATQFEDTVTNRLVINYYNRQSLQIYLNPGYVDNNAQNTFNQTNSTWAALNGGTGSTGTYIANGEDTVSVVAFNGRTAVAPNGHAFGIGFDTTTKAVTATILPGNSTSFATVTYAAIPAEGYRTVSLVGVNMNGGETSTYWADCQQFGAGSPDPKLCTLSCIIQG